MDYFVIQVALFLTVALVVGIFLGWWASGFRHVAEDAESQTELTGLRRMHDDAIKENTVLRLRLRQAEEALQKLGSAELDEADYGKYLQARKALEASRKKYEELLEKFHQQEQRLAKLKQELQKWHGSGEGGAIDASVNGQGQLPAKPQPMRAMSSRVQEDDLTCIPGINAKLADKLRALGIMTYRQIAEFTHDDVRNIQHIIGAELNLPLESWVREARQLFQQKYSPA